MKFAVPALHRVRQSLATLLPLMTRELTEQSARRRTYVMRVIYAFILYGFTLWAFWNELGSWSSQSFAFLGRGRQFFEGLAWLQFCGLYLFLPAMTSGLLTSEKERDTLSLLLLTRLGPWSILMGKLFSRLVPMASFVLLSLPLVAVAYSLGGVNENDIVSLAWVLAVTALQMGSLGLACSAWCRTTAASFMATYLIGGALIAGLPIVTNTFSSLSDVVEFVRQYCDEQGLGGKQRFNSEEVGFLWFGPWASLHPNSLDQPFHVTLLRTVPMLMFAATCLVFARCVLWRRAFVAPSNFLLKIFRSLDTVFHRLNQNRLTRGIVLTRENVTLPVFDPIRWRETKKRSLGTTRYLIRLLLLLEVPVLFGMLIPHYGSAESQYAPVYVAAWILWIVATLVIAIQSTGLIGSERSRQTLDVLLTTPMLSETIVQEKFAGVWRMIRMLWIPFATVYLFQFWWLTWVANSMGSHSGQVVYGLVRGALAMGIYPLLIAWLGFHFGMRCRSQTQATLITVSLIAGFCLIPALLAEYFYMKELYALYEIRWLSPAIVVSVSSEPHYREYYYAYRSSYDPSSTVWPGTLLHFLGAGLLLIWLWARGLRTFAVRVNRNDGQVVDDDDLDRLSQLRQKIVGDAIFRSKHDDE
jgi:ABC-type transport system involved in multi-copper enzyme maturation permease subunit